MPQVRHSAPSGTSQKMLKQILHTKPVSTTRRWQKHAARKSTVSCVGVTNVFRVSASARNPHIRYESRPRGLPEAERKVPEVMKAACCRNVGVPCSDRVSIAMRACEAANTAFMVGMYCAGSESETERMKIRECRVAVSAALVTAVVEGGRAGSDEVLVGWKEVVILLV